ncbi:hypothetical protein ACLKA6_010981 [Drosophila palustris]
MRVAPPVPQPHIPISLPDSHPTEHSLLDTRHSTNRQSTLDSRSRRESESESSLASSSTFPTGRTNRRVHHSAMQRHPLTPPPPAPPPPLYMPI